MPKNAAKYAGAALAVAALVIVTLAVIEAGRRKGWFRDPIAGLSNVIAPEAAASAAV